MNNISRELTKITTKAHIETFHPNQLEWPDRFGSDELKFLSELCFGDEGHEQESLIYICKELSVLSEIEKHVSAAMVVILSELQDHQYDDLNQWDDFNHALSCFAAEELNHANTFYRYVRRLSEKDIKCSNNYMNEKINLYQGADSPWVKLVALCSAAYVGESVITVFENRAKSLDPKHNYYFTQLLHAHGLDEARHVKIDHFVFDHVFEKLTIEEKQKMHEILVNTQEYDRLLSEKFSELYSEYFNLDYITNNLAYEVQMKLTLSWRELIFKKDQFVKVDEINNHELDEIVESFSKVNYIHFSEREYA